MLTYIYLCIILLTVNTINTLPAPLTDADIQDNKLTDPSILERFGVGSNQLLLNRQFIDDDEQIDNDDIVHDKRQLKKKWAKFFRDSHSPYTIAFPALIRSRRWAE